MVVVVHVEVHGFNSKIQTELQPLLTTLAECSGAVNTCTAVFGGPVVRMTTLQKRKLELSEVK